ncbi:MAG: PIN domain-containing protein [Selenomonadaceae bacterium]|nr:PIN domain-containing protein [Selenomonadaceae bacterium]
MVEAIRYCLDSNVVSDILRLRPDVIQHMDEALDVGSELYICSIVYYELTRGMKSSKAVKKLKVFHDLYDKSPHLFLDRVSLTAIDKAADIYAELHRGKQIEDNDIYIAAIAMVNGCTLVTSNTRHFGRIADLQIVDWRSEQVSD